MSYCRITGKAKGLPKPNYFPLLPPISPADAKRFCRITGKAYGLPSHRYIPVILTAFSNKLKCKITNSTKYDAHHYEPDYNYGKRKHIILTDYRYMFPVFDETNDQQKNLIDLLNSKLVQFDDHEYIYTIAEKKCNLVFSAQLEAAVRDGDVRDVMFAKTNDSVLLRMSKGKNVSLDLQDYNTECEGVEKRLFEGEGPREDVLLAREMEEKENEHKQLKRKENLMHMAKIFENKDMQCDDDEQQTIMHKKNGIKKQRMSAKQMNQNNNNNKNQKIKYDEVNGISDTNAKLHIDAVDWNDMVKPMIESWDFEKYTKESSKNNCKPITNKLPTPHKIEAEIIEPPHNIEIDVELLKNTIGFDAIACIMPLEPCHEKPNSKIIQSIVGLDDAKKANLTNIMNKMLDDAEFVKSIPMQNELIKILQNYTNGVIVNDENANVTGLSINIGTENEPKNIILLGCIVNTENGEEFICGRTITNENDSTFEPGVHINTENGISFIPSFVVKSQDPNRSDAILLAGQIVNDEFVCGQTMYTNNSPRFVHGETVVTHDGIKFVPGLVNEKTKNFVCGQVLTIPDGTQKFIAGQMITAKNGTEQFFSGQCVYSEEENEWIFVHGQVIDDKFVAGKSITTKEGAKFVPGVYVDNIFIPGITTESEENGLKFVCGLNIETKHGEKFVQGQMVNSDHGEIFLPGITTLNKAGEINFSAAKTMDNIVCNEPVSTGYVIDSNSIEVNTPSLSVFGYMIQTQNGIEFYPSKIDSSQLPEGKIVTGKLIRQNLNTKFVPGIMENDGFIPGQLVWTEQGEKFVEGQVIETASGLKFVPGRVSSKLQ